MKQEMEQRNRVVLSILFATFLHVGHGCQMEGHASWIFPVQQNILDSFRGIVLSRATTNIQAINSISYGESTEYGPYFDISLIDSLFEIRTNAAFDDYEENEVASRVSVTINFSCTGGTSNSLLFWIDITDTNNNAPRFSPTGAFEFEVAPPLPPGFLVTGCFNDITVRDIDLTTQRIDYTIEDNPYFEIAYDESASTVAKEFKAQLRTTTFIRSLSEPVTLTITATDVDLTGDPPLSTTATVRIVGDSEFQFPEEPIFAQTFYLADYTEDHQLHLSETISLKQGFDEFVNFTLEGDYAEFFALNPSGNQQSLTVVTPVPEDIWPEKQIFLVVRASREFTSGDAVTVIVQLPEEVALMFERVYYEGTILDNNLQLSPLILSQGYEGATNAAVVGEYSTYFTATIQGNLVTVTMSPLTDDIIDDNSFIPLQVVARSDRGEASTVVNLKIIKDDNVTPVFDKSIYSGTYDPITGLTAEQITILQGFDETVSIELVGDDANYFQYNQNGPVITLTSSTLPPALYSQQNILISIVASKPRTVGANAAIRIALPEARQLEFEESTYIGTIEGEEVTLQTIVLRSGHEYGVNFDLTGEYATYFTATNMEDQVAISLSSPLPETVITQNSVIMLTLTASGLNAVTTSTSILLNIIKDDTTTPIFSRSIYHGTYSGQGFVIEPISLAQGFGNDVSFRIDGDHSQYFEISNNGNNPVITLRSPIPEDVIFNEKVLIFNVFAEKALTVGANAAILIRFPTELTESTIMRFSKNTYIGTLEENEVTLENIVLDTGFATGTEFILTGEYAEHFTLTDANNVVQISSLNTLPNEVIDTRDFIVLDIEARRERAVSVWTSVVIDILKQEITAPVFNQAYYTGVYTADTGLTFEETINLTTGYDATVAFDLAGESANWFSLVQEYNYLSLVLRTPIPVEVLENNNYLLFTIIATKPNAITGRAVISIDLPKDFTDSSFRFQQDFYKGYIENGSLSLSEIILGDYTSDVEYTFTGDYEDYFQLTHQNGRFILQIESPLTTEVLEERNVFVFTLEAQNTYIRTHTVIIIEFIKSNEIIEPIEFEEPYYVGALTESDQLEFNSVIRLTNGIDPSVEFGLEGDNAEWFNLLRIDVYSVNVTLTSPIPAAVIANNQQLVFVVTAQSPGSAKARATVVISLLNEYPEGTAFLGFDRVSYFGSIENNQANIPAITLSEGYTQDVAFTLHGELNSYFSVSNQGAVVTVTLQGVIPEESVPENRIILLYLQASALQSVTAYATIVIENVVNDNVSPVVELIFAQTFYSGVYDTSVPGLSFPTPISLTQGYDFNVDFDLEGENSQWFGLVRNGNSVTVTLTSPIPAAVIANNQQLVFVVTAQSPGSATARATVVISLLNEYPEGTAFLGFDRVSYFGSIENNQANIPAITLSEGYTQDVAFTLHGELNSYFSVSNQGAVVTVTLQGVIPEESVPENRIILLYLQASALQSVTAYATIVIENVVNDNVSPVVELIFAQTFYSGVYDTSVPGLSFPTPISLTQGYDFNVDFDLEGENSQWFGLVRNGNSVTVTLTSPIPAAVIANNQQLVFVVTAQSPGSATARATVVISLLNEYPEGTAFLGFDRVSYFGSIENNQANIPAITLSEGYTQDVAFTLHGELNSYFSVSNQGAVVTVTLQGVIPEESVPENRIILLYLQASALQSVTAYATIVIENVVNDNVSPVVELIFAQTFYSGVYDTSVPGLSFPTPISLTQGYDFNVDFDLEGENSQWFGLVRNGNSVTVTLTSPIPAAVIANNQQLVFVVTAQSPGSATARATVVISLLNEYPEGTAFLGFDRVSYFGSIENNQANIPAITLSEGYTQDVAFTLHGELNSYFSVSNQGAVVTVTLQGVIPEESVPENRIILLYLQASALQSVTAYATIVIENVVNDNVSPVVELIFAQTFYSGIYDTSVPGLSFPTPISLAQGYDSNVDFDLEGENSQWFGLVRNGNSVTVTLTSPIPAAVIANNQQLVFVVTAQSPGSATARTTVIISLLNEYPEGTAFLGFDRVSYFGSIENNQANIPAITLSEGYTQDVAFTLHGELNSYFSVSNQGAVVTVTLQGVIPEESVPENRIILLYLQASALQSVTAYATIVIENVVNDNVSPVVELIFAQTFYSGIYDTSVPGLSFPTPISLAQGYDSNVDFDLEGENSQWFGLVRNGNSVTVTLTSPIPAAVIANNQQLVFVVTAQSPGSATARATVVISLLNEYPEGTAFLGFDRVSYFGSIENNQANIPAITLSEGYTQDVAFTLHGELNSYFSVSNQGAVVTVTLQGVIPEELLPENRIILLYLQASALQSVTAYATIVIENVVNDNVSPVVELIFAQTFYSGVYDTSVPGLSFPTPISLTQGYDSNVDFDLEGENSQWFGLVRNGNSVTVTLTSPIPAAVIANNQQLVFVVTAQSPGSATARATVVISLLNEYPEGTAFLGFDRVSYFGSIENNQANIPAITLSEGYTQDVAFTLHGELNSYFSVSNQGAVVTVTLQGIIPEESVPANRIILLYLQASALQSVTAYATIVIENVMNDNVSPVVELIFAQTFYSGIYDTNVPGLSFPTPISITQGYDSNVDFDLEGENSQWFGLVRNGNSVTVTLTSPIPAAVIANNHQLVFVVTAQSPGSATARATVIISLVNEYPEGTAFLGFDRVSYFGSIENNQANIPAITLSEGFTQDVAFTLHGELNSFFRLSNQGAIVTVELQGVIPEELIPTNKIILLEIQATALHSITAYATIVIQYSPVVELIFAQTFYSGTYDIVEGLLFPTPISLAQGFDSNVEFNIEGDNANWFGLVENGNSVTLTLTNPIPAAVIANNQQLIFVVTAQSPGSATARTTVVISLLNEYSEGITFLGFDRVSYFGSIENNQTNIAAIILSEGFTQDVAFTLHGELNNYFIVSNQGAIVSIELQDVIPEQHIPANRIIMLEIQATAPQSVTAFATVVFEYVMDNNVSPFIELIFAQTFYNGIYDTAIAGLSFPTPISLTQGYDSNVEFNFEGDNARWFGLVRNENSVTVTLTSAIPTAVIANNQQLVFVVTAQSPDSATARTTVIIYLVNEYSEETAFLGFDRVSYFGSIENNQANIPAITLTEGFTEDVVFTLHGELNDYFSVLNQGAVVTVELQSVIPEQSIPDSKIIVLELQAAAPLSVTAYATIVFGYIAPINELIFAQTFYSGIYDTSVAGLSFPTPISLTQGYDSNVEFDLEGDNSQWFGLARNGNSVTVTLTSPIPAAVIANNQQLVFVVTAQSPGFATARATVIISLLNDYPVGTAFLGFDRVSYFGFIEKNQANVPAITLSEGFTPDVVFTLQGELYSYFSVSNQGPVVTVMLRDIIPEELVPANRIIMMYVQATAPQSVTAYATIVIEYVVDEAVSPIFELIFEQTFYSGTYDTSVSDLSFPTSISLTQGYDSDVEFNLEGDNSQWFGLVRNGNSVTVTLTSQIPADVVANNQQLVFVVTAQSPGSATARATIIIELNDSQEDVTFEKVIFEGTIQNGVVSHETITITGFSGSIIELRGEYSSLFMSELSNDEVTVRATNSLTLPAGVTHVALELHAETASAILILSILTDEPTPTTVTFSSPSYTITVDIARTGLIGQVQATAENGEAITYSLLLDSPHLRERLSINNQGELHLSAPVSIGSYSFRVVAATVNTQSVGTAMVHLSAEAITVCVDEHAVAPLIVIDVDEEEPHYDLINGTQAGCRYSLTSRWPEDQAWIYVDEQGLHTRSIDREHESIAFMAVSQVQVELTLHCDGDATRRKRAATSEALGPYDYGNNKWILTDTILYNSRRTFVNVIVNDINDNYPIFVDKANEPIAVGYPVPELAERVLPRSLAELQATDADIDENAALVYWSSEPELAVAPTTGFVHLRDGATLENGATMTVYATDRNGEGLTGSINLLVRLLDESYIAVVTVRDAFLDDEQSILSNLTEAVGYEIKTLRSIVISDEVETNEENSRKKRDVTNAAGASLQMYVYGLIARQPVTVDKLTTDINNIAIAPVTVASTVSLQDHLECQTIGAGRDTGLLVSTIILSVLLFIVLVLIAVWFFLRWRKNRNYNQFSEENSLASREESVDKFPKTEALPKPRLDIAELKKSERRLKEMLDAPIQKVTVDPVTSRNDAIVDMPIPEPAAPIVIQSIDKLKDAADGSEDEYGEVSPQAPKRKSVVTFNENVEKIIHVEDTDADDFSVDPEYEIYKL